MPSANNTESPDMFPDLPPFPTDIPTAPLLQLSLSELGRSEVETFSLFKASKDLGFFYLDLRGDALGDALLDESDRLFEVSKELFEEGPKELEKFDYSAQGSYYGYKGLGKKVVDLKGTKDRNEFYNAAKDDFLDQSTSPLAHPATLMDNKSLLTSYTAHAHELLTRILSHINTHLSLPTSTLSALHDISVASGDHIRFVRAPPQPPADLGTALGAHTDFGSLTLLFNRVGGLQVLLPTTNTWAYVRPLPGRAIVNLGDALVKFSGGLLRSNIHRVVAPPGEQAATTRYSLVYFMRPGDDVSMKRLKGGIVPQLQTGEEEEEVTSKEWIRDKAMAGRVGASIEEQKYMKQRITNKAELELVAREESSLSTQV